MLGKCREEDFYVLESVASTRLSPGVVPAFLIISTFIGVMATGFSVGISTDKTIFNVFGMIELVFVVIGIVFCIFFLNEKNMFKFQRTSFFILCVYGVKLVFDFYLLGLACFEGAEETILFNYLSLIGYLTILFLCFTTVRACVRVRKGFLRKGQNGLYDFKDSKLSLGVPMVFYIIIMVRVLSEYLTTYTNMPMDLVIIAICITTLMVTLSLALPEFFLLFYCKCKFPAFIIKSHTINVYEANEKSKNEIS